MVKMIKPGMWDMAVDSPVCSIEIGCPIWGLEAALIKVASAL